MPDITYCHTQTKSIMYMHLIHDNQFRMNYHMHDRFEIYFIVSGTVEFFVERSLYTVNYGELMVINSHEIHKSLLKSNMDYERIIVEFDPAVLSPFNLSGYNLLACFTQRPKGVHNKMALKPGEIAELKRLYDNFERMGESQQENADLLKQLYLIELLVFINGVFLQDNHSEKGLKVPKRIIPILDYIDNNLEENLSLQEIAGRFFIDKYYLSRLFLKITGINIHDYILSRRIFRAKELLRGGKSILDACQMSGFSNYSTFVRAFKNHEGVLPKEYKKSLMPD